MTELKTCTKCGEDKPATVEYFHRDGARLRGDCKDCQRCYGKQYREENREKVKAAVKKWQKENPEKKKASEKKWREENPEHGKKWREENREKKKAGQKKWREENPKYSRERRRKDPVFRLMGNMRSGLWKGLKGLGKNESTFKYIGMTPDQLMDYLEGQFTPRQIREGMTQDNYGKWHVDHIRPLASFDFAGPDREEQLHIAWHYNNYQPMWAADNCSKGAKYDGK